MQVSHCPGWRESIAILVSFSLGEARGLVRLALVVVGIELCSLCPGSVAGLSSLTSVSFGAQCTFLAMSTCELCNSPVHNVVAIISVAASMDPSDSRSRGLPLASSSINIS